MRRFLVRAASNSNQLNYALRGHTTDPFARPFLESIEADAQRVGVRIQPVVVRGAEEFDQRERVHSRKFADVGEDENSIGCLRIRAGRRLERRSFAGPGARALQGVIPVA